MAVGTARGKLCNENCYWWANSANAMGKLITIYSCNVVQSGKFVHVCLFPCKKGGL